MVIELELPSDRLTSIVSEYDADQSGQNGICSNHPLITYSAELEYEAGI